jgi:hypothetical protein
MSVLGASLGDVRGSTYILKWFEYGNGIVWCLHHFLN